MYVLCSISFWFVVCAAVNFPPNVGSLEEDWLDEQRALHSQPPQQQQEGEEEEQDEQSQVRGVKANRHQYRRHTLESAVLYLSLP
jgi:hypothetical protein